MNQEICEHWDKFVTQSLQNRPVYKDECSKCFLTPKDQNGLNVCLTCLQGSCSAKNNHTDLHYKNTFSGEQDQHPIFLNIKMTKKVAAADEKPKEITKLAIGKPGGVDAEADKWDTNVKIFCTPCHKELSLQNPKISSMVQSVMLAQSAFNDSTITEWELELSACSHTKNLDQSTSNRIAEKSMAHCGDCDLKSNLWLCMSCGHLGCGRKNYDGTGGNNHAVDHAQSSHHPVVCKLGTITPQGTASIHCYDCDDEVLDNNLGEHLGRLGIDLRAQTKTEKSTTELNLEANLSLTLSKVLEEGKILIPVFGEGLTGMVNLGNTCYMNSVLQVVMALPEFKERFLPEAEYHLNECRKWTPDCYICQMSKLAIGIYSGEYSQKKIAEKVINQENEGKPQDDEFYQEGIRPQLLKTLFGKGHKEFQTAQQQDAREYFQYFIEKLQKAEKAIKGTNDPTKAFEFQVEQRLQCLECNHVKYIISTEKEMNLQAPVSSKAEAGTEVTLQSCLENYFAQHIIDDLQCQNCKKKTAFAEYKRFKTYPKHLIVVLQRFVLDDWVPRKLEVNLTFDPNSIQNFEKMKGQGIQSNELLMQSEENQEDEVEPEINQEVLNQLLQIGIPEVQAKHAIYRTGNSDVETAQMWFFENMEDPTIQTPLKVKATKQNSQKLNDQNQKRADPEHVIMIESMGFTNKQAERALRKCDYNLERACDWIFSHMDEPLSDNEMQVDQDSSQIGQSEKNIFECSWPEKGLYQLSSFITHLGTSVHAGHYVCHIRKNKDWIYFNDAKVASCPEPPFGKGFVYVFSKIV